MEARAAPRRGSLWAAALAAAHARGWLLGIVDPSALRCRLLKRLLPPPTPPPRTTELL
jgi:hypothetical protein